MDWRKAFIVELQEAVNEVCARELSTNNTSEKLKNWSLDNLYKQIILNAARLRAKKEMDFELFCEDTHISYCDSVYDLIADALYIEHAA